MKQFVVEESFWKVFPDAEIGIISADGILPTSEISIEKQQQAQAYLQKANARAQKWIENPTISKNSVVAVWREAYRKFKTKKGARCAIENLLKRILHDNPVGSICPSVDISNGVSLTYALPMGAENIDAIEGDLRLIQTQEGGHPFVPLGEDEDDPTLPMEIAYVDDAGAVCRCWNWRDGVRTATSDTTPHCVFVMECIDPARSTDLHAAIDELSELLHDILGAEITNKDFITQEHPVCEII